MKRFPLVLFVVSVLSIQCFANITIETVPVGDAGNAPDIRYSTPGRGSVSYAYNVGKYEVTAGQYTAFLNAVAAIDTYGLYNTGMSNTSYGSGITRSGASGSYTYSVATDFVNRPVNYVSFWDACRFTNWLHNGQPNGQQSLSTTEDGAYLINGYNGMDGHTIQRKTNSTWFLPSDDEWYKAAYYKGGSTSAGYWDYPTRSDTAPGRDMADPSGNNANYDYHFGLLPIDSGKYTTIVGEFQNSYGPYGTFDQGGNVWEWNEPVTYWSGYEAPRRIRGGSFATASSYLGASFLNADYPRTEVEFLGFRVVQAIPEPSSLMILAGGVLALAGVLRKRR